MKTFGILSFIILVMVVCFFALSSFKNKAPEHNLLVAKVKTSVREEVVKKYLDSFQMVVDKTGDVQAKGNLEILREKGDVVVPTAEKFTKPVPDTNGESRIRIVPLTKEDSQYPIWKSELSNPSSASFDAETSTLVLKDVVMVSPAYRGFTLAHESEHAKLNFDDPNRVITPQSLAKEEVDAYEFENRLISQYGGEKYSALLKKTLEEVKPVIVMNDQGVSFPELPYYSEMDTIFGIARSPEETHMRAFLFGIDVMYHYFDDLNPEYAINYKVEFTKSLYAPVMTAK